MTEVLAGKIISVDITPAGSVLLDGALAGATVLPVAKVYDFTPDGGFVTINGETYSYTAVDEGTEEGGTVTIGEPLFTDAETETPILIEPYAETKIARVTLEDGGDALSVVVPHALTALLDVGQREEDNAETVVMEVRSIGELLISDIVGLRAELNPDSVPPSGDGLPPSGSPDPAAIGGIGAIFVRWTALDTPDFVTYEVHIGIVPDFVPNAGTLVAQTTASSITVRTQADGSPLAYDTTYYFKIIAADNDGSAEPSLPASAMMVKISGPDIAADYVYAGNIIADQIIGGTINADLFMAGSIKTAEAGARVELGAFGFIVYDSTGQPTTLLGSDGISTFKGQVIASTLSVTNGMSIQGTANELAQAASLTLAAGVSASPNAPTVVNDWEMMPAWETSLGDPWPAGYEYKSMQRIGTKWLVGMRQISNDQFVGRKFNDDGTYDSYLGNGWTAQQIQRCAQPTLGHPLYGFRNTDRRIVAATHSIDGGAEINALAWDFTSGQPANTTEEGTVSYPSGRCRLSVTAAVGPASYLHDNSLRNMRGQRFTAQVWKVGTFTQPGQRIELRIRNDNAGEYILARIEGDDTDIHFQTYNGSPGSTKIALAARPPDGYYWRITESNGDAKLLTSSNGSSWTVVATITDHGLTDADLASMQLSLIVDDEDEGTATTGEFDNVTIGMGFTDFGDNIAWADASNVPAMGSDGVNLLVAERTSDSRIKIYEVDPRSPGRIVTTYTSGTSTDFGSFIAPLVTVTKGSFDFGATRFIVTTGNSGDQFSAVFTVSGTTLTYQRNESFYVFGQGGSGWDGTVFQTLATDGVRRKHTSILWTGVADWTRTFYAATTWYDGDATGGTHETTASPRAAFSLKKRSRYTVTSGDIPDLGEVDDPDRIRIYAADTPSATLWRQTTTAEGVNSAVLSTMTLSGTAAPIVNDFPDAIAAQIVNADGTLTIDGGGSIQAVTADFSGVLTAGPTTVDALTITGWLTPVQVTGPTAQTDTGAVEADIPQLTHTVNVPGTWAKYRVTLDLAVGSFGNGTFTGYLNVNGANDAKTIVTTATASGNRQQPSRTYIVTGLAAGNRVFKARYVSSAASPNNHRFYASQCCLTIEQIL